MGDTQLKSDALMEQMKLHLATDAGKELVNKIGLVYQINIAPKKIGFNEVTFVVDLKKGEVKKAANHKCAEGQRAKMESWVPLFHIFLNSPTPETEASLWLQRSFSVTATTITPTSFIALLTKPYDANVPAPSSPATTKRLMFLQTLPHMVQSRILSFLAFDHDRFSSRNLCRLARDVLGGDGGVDFWVHKAARNLLDVLSESSYEWISCLSLDSGGDSVQHEFASVPGWLNDAVGMDDLFVPWLPISPEELNSRNELGAREQDLFSVSSEARGDDGEEVMDVVAEGIEIDNPLEGEVQEMAANMRARIMHFESSSRTITLANEIRELCLGKGVVDSFAVLGLLEPWKVDDETASVLISHLCSGGEEELAWPSQVLCALVLPKLLVLQEPASRILLTATIEYCKLHQRASVYGLLFPLLLREEGINNPVCDIITRIIKECLHPAHVSAFCQKLLCGGEDERRFVCLPCHRHLISNELVWTESMFNLFQNVLNCNVYLTQDSVDILVCQVHQHAKRFSKSLKFGNFLLCLVRRCFPLLKSHKLLLIEATEDVNSLVAKSILSKLATL